MHFPFNFGLVINDENNLELPGFLFLEKIKIRAKMKEHRFSFLAIIYTIVTKNLIFFYNIKTRVLLTHTQPSYLGYTALLVMKTY